MLKVLNIKKVDLSYGLNMIYIGRKNSYKKVNGSVLANIYTIGKDGNREEVIEKYRKWLWLKIKNKDQKVMNELIKIGKKVKNGKKVNLVCWCSPKGCHGDVLVRCIKWMISEGLIE